MASSGGGGGRSGRGPRRGHGSLVGPFPQGPSPPRSENIHTSSEGCPWSGPVGRQPRTWQAGLTAGLLSSVPVAVTLGSGGKQDVGREVQESFFFFLSVRPICSLVCQQPLSPFNAQRLILCLFLYMYIYFIYLFNWSHWVLVVAGELLVAARLWDLVP